MRRIRNRAVGRLVAGRRIQPVRDRGTLCGMSTRLRFRYRLRAGAQRIYVHARIQRPDLVWLELSLGLAAVLYGLVVAEPPWVLVGVALGSSTLMLYGITSALGIPEEEAERLRFGQVVPDARGLTAWRQVLAYAGRRSSEDSHPKWAMALGAIFVFVGIYIPGAYDTQDSPAWLVPGFGVAALIAAWLLELVGAAFMREPEEEDWDPIWHERVLNPNADKQPWQIPSFWLLVVLFAGSVAGVVISL